MSISTLKDTKASHDYPGLGLHPRHRPEEDGKFYPIGAHQGNSCSLSEPLYVRELAMMDVMEKLTDKPDWHKKVFDEEIVAKWQKEALEIPDEYFWSLATAAKTEMINPTTGEVQFRDAFDEMKKPEEILDANAFKCCVQELRSKAKHFEKTGIVPTLEACASVAKSDSLVSPKLHEALRQAFDKLKADHSASPDWHPDSNDMVQDLVHPSMYPLVYGRSRLFKEECVGVSDAVHKWAGKGEVLPTDAWPLGARDSYLPPEFWSHTYQWLPANVAFRDGGKVQFTSYINNLHPTKYPDIYRTIEDLVQTALPLWDQCLAIGMSHTEREGAGRTTPRMGPPENPDDDHEENWIPSDCEECADAEVSEEDLDEVGWDPEYNDESELPEHKWKVVRKPRLPSVTFSDVDYAPKQGKRLAELFRETGLQIIVKLASIELTPEKPEFPVGGWHIEGQMNEHICGTALYYLDSENITSTNLSFRMQTSESLQEDERYSVGQDMYHWMGSVFGTCMTETCLQNYGNVETREGRLLAFPNVFQHRVSPFKLVDPTKPGHRRFIALWLVDPFQRIINTANVPPQQMTWFADSLLGTTSESRAEGLAKLPPELIDLVQKKGMIANDDLTNLSGENAKLPAELMGMVRDYFDANGEEMPMSVEEANHHRKVLMKERGAFRSTAVDSWQNSTYSFCEH